MHTIRTYNENVSILDIGPFWLPLILFISENIQAR
jgi:hypothetical protein